MQPEDPHTAADVSRFALAAAGAMSEMARRVRRMRFIDCPFVGSHCLYNAISDSVPMSCEIR